MTNRESADTEPRPDVNTSRRNFLRLAIALGGAAALEAVTGCGTHPSDARPSEDPTPDGAGEKQQPSAEFASHPSWEQDFAAMPDGPIDPAVWTYDTDPNVPRYNQEKQGYTKNQKNVRIEDGRLVIEAHREPYAYPDDPEHHYDITSARIDTRDSFTFEYGKLEAKLKLPTGEGTWPAFWLLSANNPYTGKQPWDESDKRFYMHDGELDIMEAYGSMPGAVEATVHTYAKSQEKQVPLPGDKNGFHTFGVEITPGGIVWTLDGRAYYEVKKPSDNPDQWPFGEGNKLYAILNLAMGGSGGGEIDPAKNTWRMEAEGIKFYEFTGR